MSLNERLAGLVKRMRENALPPHKDCTNGWADELEAILAEFAPQPQGVTLHENCYTCETVVKPHCRPLAQPAPAASDTHRCGVPECHVEHKGATPAENVERARADELLARLGYVNDAGEVPEDAVDTVVDFMAAIRRESEAREALAAWMTQMSFSTGHGDTLGDLLHELEWQVKELREKIAFLEGELKAVETKAGIENVFEQGKAMGFAEGVSKGRAEGLELREAVQAIVNRWDDDKHDYRGRVMIMQLKATLATQPEQKGAVK